MTDETTLQSVKDTEDRTFVDNDSSDIPPSDVIAYNELRSCADLYRMYRDDILEIPTPISTRDSMDESCTNTLHRFAG